MSEKDIPQIPKEVLENEQEWRREMWKLIQSHQKENRIAYEKFNKRVNKLEVKNAGIALTVAFCVTYFKDFFKK